jgi:multiple sugar transport system permease protein
VYIFNKGNSLNLGYASAMAIVLALLLSAVAFPYLRSMFSAE